MAKRKRIPLQFVAWANIEKWRMLRGISNEQLAGILGIKNVGDRKKSGYLTWEETDRICAYFDIEPEKLMER